MHVPTIGKSQGTSPDTRPTTISIHGQFVGGPRSLAEADPACRTRCGSDSRSLAP